VIPHFLAELSKLKLDAQHLCMPTLMPAEFIRRIVNSSLVISSSLHGLILAEAYGVPTVFLNVWHTENILKYEDYYLGTGRPSYPSVSSIDEALSIERNPPPDFAQIQRSLLDAFPFDLWAC
jgi:pyruvyltransferase